MYIFDIFKVLTETVFVENAHLEVKRRAFFVLPELLNPELLDDKGAFV